MTGNGNERTKREVKDHKERMRFSPALLAVRGALQGRGGAYV